jgi:3,4-dihydroxy 2-butanone 4-phosphate synthase / GTP cyclohydrolase II
MIQEFTSVASEAMLDGLADVESAIEAFRRGELLIVVDDAHRENEGDLIQAAEHVTAESINFMARFARGLICVTMTGDRLDQLQIPMMVQNNQSPHRTAFTVSVEAAGGISTGISAADRARTVQVLADPESRPADLVQPGHIFPLRAQPGGVLARAGHTEAGVDLARLAGLQPAAAICEVMNDDGTMARLPELLAFGAAHNIQIVSIAQLINYRHRTEKLVKQVTQSTLPTDYADFALHVFEEVNSGQHHVALVLGEWQPEEPVLVRIHSECLTGDLFGSRRCDCGDQLHTALARIAAAGRGVLLYMRQEGRGIGLANKIRAYALQEQGYDTVEANEALGFPADLRHYGIAAQILAGLGVEKLHLLTNNPRKLAALAEFGLDVVARSPIVVSAGVHNQRYLHTKREKLGHLLD